MALESLFDKSKAELIEMLMSEQQRRKYYQRLYRKASREMWEWLKFDHRHHIADTEKIWELQHQIYEMKKEKEDNK